jgi:heterodisulfide reductase subunit D
MTNNISVPILADMHAKGEKPEILLWVGCSASYDTRSQKIIRALCSVLNRADVRFAILGDEENCCGDPARRAGNEFVFQMLAHQNIQLFRQYEITRIVTICPHGYNTFKNEYPVLGASLNVQHHTQFLLELIEQGRLKVNHSKDMEITLHDSCYLGRINGDYNSPRKIMEALKIEVVELERNKQNGFCCGAGGSQMFKEEETGLERVSTNRVTDIVKTKCKTVATNCPFCTTMLMDGLKEIDKEEEVEVKDIVEILLDYVS